MSKPGILTGFLADTHIYNNHVEQVNQQIFLLGREFPLPSITISSEFKDVREFDASNDIILINYSHHPSIKAPVAI